MIVRLATNRSAGWPLYAVSPTLWNGQAENRVSKDVADQIVHLIMWYDPAQQESAADRGIRPAVRR